MLHALLLSLATAFAPLPSPSPAPTHPPSAFTTTAVAPVIIPAVFDGRVLVHGSVNGHELWFHFDTGAGTFAMGTDDARAVGLNVDATTAHAAPVDLILGDIHAPAAVFYVAPYGFDVHGRRVSGLFGGPLLFSYVVTIDYEHQRVIAYPPGTFDPSTTGVQATPLQIHGSSAAIQVCFGSECGWFVLDTGSEITHLSPAFAKRLNLGKSIATVHALGFGGRTEDEPYYNVPDLTVGGVTFKNPRLPVGVLRLTPLDGILGRDILSRFILTLDYKNSSAYLVHYFATPSP